MLIGFTCFYLAVGLLLAILAVSCVVPRDGVLIVKLSVFFVLLFLWLPAFIYFACGDAIDVRKEVRGG
jgi:hypothetical protein